MADARNDVTVVQFKISFIIDHAVAYAQPFQCCRKGKNIPGAVGDDPDHFSSSSSGGSSSNFEYPTATATCQCHYKIPFVEGKTILFTSLLTAILIALAKALKMASILWCSFSPSALILMLNFAESLKDLKKWKNISVGISPIFSRLNSASHTIQFLPPKSIAACARQSSIGRQKP